MIYDKERFQKGAGPHDHANWSTKNENNNNNKES